MNYSPVSTPIRSVSFGVLLSGLILFSIGCADKHKELEPRPDTRPMVDQINQAEQDWTWISREQWYLRTIDGHPPIPQTSIRLSFKEHTWLEGDAGCNRYTASYDRKADAGLKVSEILSTRMFCASPEGVMQQESRYFNLLKQVDSYHAEPHQLDMLVDGAVVLSFTIAAKVESP